MADQTAPDAATPPPATATPPAPRRARTGLIVGIAVGVVVLLGLVAGGVFALNSFMKGGVSTSASESAAAFPATTYAWVEVAIDPSPAQKLAAVEMFEKMPELREVIEDATDLDLEQPDRDADFKKAMWELLEDEGALDDVSLDYDDDVAPWLGSRVAFGLVEGGDEEEPAFIIAIEASDTELGVEAVEDLASDAELDDTEVSARDGFVLISSDSIDLDEAFEDGTLAERDSFEEAADGLGEWGIVSSWYSTRGLSAEIASIVEQDFTESGYLEAQTWEAEYGLASDEFEQALADYTLYCVEGSEYEYGDAWDYQSELFTGSCWDEVSPEAFEEHYGFAPGDWQTAATERAEYYQELVDGQQEALDEMPDGAVVGSMRFVDSSLEITGETIGAGFPAFESADDAAAIASLPDSTMLAVSFSPLGSIIDTVLSVEFLEAVPQATQFSALGELDPTLGAAIPETDAADLESLVEEGRTALEEAFAEVDLDFPGDLATMFGRSTVIAVDEDLDCDDECSEPRVGALITADDVDETMSLFEELLAAASDSTGGEVDFDMVDEGDRVAFAAGDYADELLAEGDRLGDDPDFARALPDLGGATMAYYIDIEELVSALSDAFGGDDEDLDVLEGLAAFGATITQQEDGDFVSRMRISAES